jgi:predicted O-methyltransferase YrrM
MDAIQNEALYEYCKEHSSDADDVLDALERETYLKTISPGMLSGPVQGKLLTLITRMIGARIALEIGTFTGYASICIAKGLPENGKLVSLEIEKELSYFHEKYFPLAGMGSKIEVIYGDANMTLPKLDYKFDLAFIDAGKKDYEDQYELVLNKMDSGGVILADNVLWKMKVLDENPDKITRNIMHFNRRIKEDERVDNFILPIRDGINMIRKR